jgi:hypothetical protein
LRFPLQNPTIFLNYLSQKITATCTNRVNFYKKGGCPKSPFDQLSRCFLLINPWENEKPVQLLVGFEPEGKF